MKTMPFDAGNMDLQLGMFSVYLNIPKSGHTLTEHHGLMQCQFLVGGIAELWSFTRPHGVEVDKTGLS